MEESEEIESVDQSGARCTRHILLCGYTFLTRLSYTPCPRPALL